MTDAYLMEGPLLCLADRRQAMVARMAETLKAAGCDLGCEDDVVHVLRTQGYSAIDVAILAGDARAVAFQDVVAREMAQP